MNNCEIAIELWIFVSFSWPIVKILASYGICDGQSRPAYSVRSVGLRGSRRNFLLGLALVTLSVLATHAADQQTTLGTPLSITVTQKTPLESIAPDGSVVGVSEATVGAKFMAVSTEGSLMILQDDKGSRYRIAAGSTDYASVPSNNSDQQNKSLPKADVPPSEMPPKPILNGESGAINFSASSSSDTLFSLGLKDSLTASAWLELVEPDGKIDSVPACTLTQAWSITKSDPAKGEIALSWAAPASSAAERIEYHLRPSSDGWGTLWQLRITFRPNERAKVRIAFQFPHSFLWAGFESGPLQLYQGEDCTKTVQQPLDSIYVLDKTYGSFALVPQQPQAISSVTLHTGVSNLSTGFNLELAASNGNQIEADFLLFPSKRMYPVHRASKWVLSSDDDRATMLLGIYAGAAGGLDGAEIPASCYPTIRNPGRHYGNLNNFFDPDTYFPVAQLAYSGDPYLEREARRILERSAKYETVDGQIPHHFDGEEPVMTAISGTTQTGPNLFWLLACHDYIVGTGDENFLKRNYPAMKRAADWLLVNFHPDCGLIDARGPLWVDTFRKEGFTYDTNAMAVWVFERLAFLSDEAGDPSGAHRFREVSAEIRKGIMALWEGDHFITAIREDGSRFDMQDADSYSAEAFGILEDTEKAGRMMNFLDAIPHMHAGDRGTWVSGKYYDASLCYQGNTGDSACAMARLWWIDLEARQRLGDKAGFERYYRPVQSDLFSHLWMTERYDENGNMIRAVGYTEYQSVLAQLMRECIYGIHLTLATVDIRPLKPGPWTFSNGKLTVVYDQNRFEVTVPGKGMRKISIAGFRPGAIYRIGDKETVIVATNGQLMCTCHAGTTLMGQLIR